MECRGVVAVAHTGLDWFIIIALQHTTSLASIQLQQMMRHAASARQQKDFSVPAALRSKHAHTQPALVLCGRSSGPTSPLCLNRSKRRAPEDHQPRRAAAAQYSR
eukprot:GHUV01026651.1.p1 GENE.GHUV01026651.1~~GHUV01026651.1.p1  ORF type:complete len:114 (+),score=8.27 GHUV01026651.1:30-344(+)